ncbi:MAG: insulinase family protein [Acidimicrobiia bacterium]|nr:insulinase family protein [Acidimicrobiia bacterium]
MHYQLSTLPNGLRVITEEMPSLRSVAIGCWVDTGTRDEAANEAGASHFLEHLLFKGSEKLSARQIAETFDSIGAQSNAFTTKDHTCYWARLVDTEIPTSLDVLGEMLQRPAFREKEIDSERSVVIEEINMNEDDPSDTAFEEFTSTVFGGHSLERPVLGTRESIKAMTPDDIAGYWSRRYGAVSTVVAAAGSINHEEFVEMVADRFGAWEVVDTGHDSATIEPRTTTSIITRDTEQANLVYGGIGLDRSDERRWAFDILNHVLGGGMSSRLFNEIREERGLAYAVSSFRLAYADTGAWGVYVGTTPGKAGTALSLIDTELERIVKDGITTEELDRARGAMQGSLALVLEDPNSRMVRLGRDELTGAPHFSVDERLAKILAVELDDIQTVAEQLFTNDRVLAAVGPFKEGELTW